MGIISIVSVQIVSTMHALKSTKGLVIKSKLSALPLQMPHFNYYVKIGPLVLKTNIIIHNALDNKKLSLY